MMQIADITVLCFVDVFECLCEIRLLGGIPTLTKSFSYSSHQRRYFSSSLVSWVELRKKKLW